MDTYFNTIPYDLGEDVRKRVRERDGSDNEECPRKRGRADTGALLASEDDGQEVKEPLEPEEDLDKYDRMRLQKGLKYINEAATRKITPRTQEFLRLHKDAYEIALDSEAPDKASRAVVQALDRVYYSAAFYFKPASSEDHQRYMYFVKLRRLELLANYGDYLGYEVQGVRAELKAKAIGASPEVQQAAEKLGPRRTWVEIPDELIEDEMSDVTRDDLRRHVHVACGVLGIDPTHMSWLIKEWAERNRTFHNQTRQYIHDCHWGSLAEQISRDLKELLNVEPDRDTAAKYEQVLLSIRSEYFNVITQDDPQHWIPDEKATKLIRERMAKDEKKAQK